MAVRVVVGSLRGSGGRKAWLAAQLNATVSARMVFARCQHDDARDSLLNRPSVRIHARIDREPG